MGYTHMKVIKLDLWIYAFQSMCYTSKQTKKKKLWHLHLALAFMSLDCQLGKEGEEMSIWNSVTSVHSFLAR